MCGSATTSTRCHSFAATEEFSTTALLLSEKIPIIPSFFLFILSRFGNFPLALPPRGFNEWEILLKNFFLFHKVWRNFDRLWFIEIKVYFRMIIAHLAMGFYYMCSFSHNNIELFFKSF